MRIYNSLKELLIEVSKLLLILFALIITVHTLINKTLFLLLQNSTTLDKNLFDIGDMRTKIILILTSLSLSWMIEYKQKEIPLVNPIKLKNIDKIFLIITASLLSYVFVKNIILLIALTIFLTLLISQFIELFKFYRLESLPKFKQFLKQSISPISTANFSYNLLVATLLILLTLYSLCISAITLIKKHRYEGILRSNLFITKILPASTTYAYKVVLLGYNFGSIKNGDAKYKLYSTYGPVTTSSWTDNTIEFIIPLHWKEGDIKFWIERPNRQNQNRMISSNVVSINLLNRWIFFPVPNDSRFTKATKKALKILYLDCWNNFYRNIFLPI